MNELQQATPQVKKNVFLIRLLLASILLCLGYFYLMDHLDHKSLVLAYGIVLGLSFVPLHLIQEDRFEKVRFQYIVFSMDLVFLLAGLYLFDHWETNLMILIFLTFFMSALSQSVGRSLVVAMAVVGLYVYLIYYKSDDFNYLDPLLLLSCALLFVVSIHSGYLAYRSVQEEREIIQLARKAALLSEKVREGDQAALEYAATLKNVLDSLPIGAIAVSVEGNVLFVNARVGKILDLNPKGLVNALVTAKGQPLGPIGEKMADSLKTRRELKREYLDAEWNGHAKRFRLDSSSGSTPSGKVWGTLFLLQEVQHPAEGARPAAG
ncbi:MAG TPA: PAS domain-containing protein [bacterium]|nr:PAS domain-containing protein [bacterium]